jgi:predicted MPP superfamily phosphohydrolase
MFSCIFLDWITALLQHPLIAVAFFLAACAGHAFFLIVGLNILYAWPLPHNVLRYTRKVDILSIFLGPVLFAYTMGFHDDRGVSREEGLRSLVTPYLAFCWAVGFFVVPAAIVRYHLRRTPTAVMGNHTQTIDVARELGYPPAGRSKQAFLTRLPGNQCFQVDFNERTLHMPQLPDAWDGLTILHLSDLHFLGTPDLAFYQHVVERCRKLGTPDLVALTGDVVDTKTHHRWIVPVLGRLRWQTAGFAILGNHDAWRDPPVIRRRLRKVGFHVLGNAWEQIEVRGRPMVVIGNECPWFRPEPDLSRCPEGVFRLCLSHTPDRIGWCRRHGVDLVLAGHVHGGQIRLPLIGSVFVPSRYSRRYDCGTFFEPPTLMHVSRGLAGQHPLRFNCRPEVTWLVLRKSKIDQPSI